MKVVILFKRADIYLFFASRPSLRVQDPTPDISKWQAQVYSMKGDVINNNTFFEIVEMKPKTQYGSFRA